MSYCILSAIPNLYYFYYLSYDCVIVTMICLQFCVYDLVQKRMTKRNFPKSHAFLNVSRFKARYKKTTRFTQFTVQVDMRLCKKRKLKNTQY